MNTDVDVLRRQLEDLQAANCRLQGERDQFRNAYTQFRLEQAPTRHERSQSNQLKEREDMARNHKERIIQVMYPTLLKICISHEDPCT